MIGVGMFLFVLHFNIAYNYLRTTAQQLKLGITLEAGASAEAMVRYCVSMYMCCVCMYALEVHVCGDLKLTSLCLPGLVSTLFIETGSFSEPPGDGSSTLASRASQFALGSLLRLVLQVDHHNYPTFTLFLEI